MATGTDKGLSLVRSFGRQAGTEQVNIAGDAILYLAAQYPG
jgi:hypothetical protein